MKIAQPTRMKPVSRRRKFECLQSETIPAGSETMAAPAWRLPGGQRLADYAMRGGFVASALLVRQSRER